MTVSFPGTPAKPDDPAALQRHINSMEILKRRLTGALTGISGVAAVPAAYTCADFAAVNTALASLAAAINSIISESGGS